MTKKIWVVYLDNEDILLRYFSGVQNSEGHHEGTSAVAAIIIPYAGRSATAMAVCTLAAGMVVGFA